MKLPWADWRLGDTLMPETVSLMAHWRPVAGKRNIFWNDFR